MTRKSKASASSGWKEHRLAQHHAFQLLSFDEKLEQIEDMADFARGILDERKRKGLPYIDPMTNERVPGVAEEAGTYGDS